MLRADSEVLKFKGENATIQHLPTKADPVKECRATRDHASFLFVVSIIWYPKQIYEHFDHYLT